MLFSADNKILHIKKFYFSPPTRTDEHLIIRSPKCMISCSKIKIKKKREKKFKALFATIKSCFLWISSLKTTTKSPSCRWTLDS